MATALVAPTPPAAKAAPRTFAEALRPFIRDGSLTHYYPLNDVYRGRDVVGGRDATNVGRVSFGPRGARFDGSNYLQIADHDDFSLTTTTRLTILASQTVSRWRGTPSAGYVHWMGKGASSTSQEWTLRHYPASGTDRPKRTSVYHYSPADSLGNGHQGAGSYFQDDDPVGVERMITARMDSTTTAYRDRGDFSSAYPGMVQLFKNGRLRDTDGFYGWQGQYKVRPRNTASPVRIGTRDGASFFIGTIRRVAFFNRKLTRAEIRTLNEARGLPEGTYGRTPSLAGATTQATLAPASVTRPSGLPWASGVFAHSSAKAAAFARTRGAPLDIVSVHPTRGSWQQTLNPWWLDLTRDYRTRPGVRLEVVVPSFAADRGVRTPQAAPWRRLGQLLVARGEANAIIRLGWEMNLPQWGHACARANRPAWVARWREAVTAMRSVPGERFRFSFVANEGPTQTDIQAADCYPGNAYVDVVGVDYYDQWYPIYTREQRQARFTRDYGLHWWRTFAERRGKAFALAEWGVSSGTQWAPHAGGDNPFYIRSVLRWLSAHRASVAYENYFDEPASFVASSLVLQNPDARAAYRARVAALR